MMNLRRRVARALDMRTIRHDRAPAREERLRSTEALRGGERMSSWRGVSGRRYVVGIRPLDGLDPAEIVDAVVLAVRRDPGGAAGIVGVASPGSAATRRERLRWLADMRARGASEAHLHLLAEGVEEREAVRRDLEEAGPLLADGREPARGGTLPQRRLVM